MWIAQIKTLAGMDGKSVRKTSTGCLSLEGGRSQDCCHASGTSLPRSSLGERLITERVQDERSSPGGWRGILPVI
jgi:hypothetical protein